MNFYLCTFADSRNSEALRRIEGQSRKFKVFDKIFIYDENEITESFKESFKHLLDPNVRGYGYWIWKPYTVKTVLDQINDGDFLLYVDAGCHLISENKGILNRYINLVRETENGIVAFQKPIYKHIDKRIICNNYFIEKRWTKGDLFEYFKVRGNELITETPQIVATSFLIIKKSQSTKLINNWYKISTEHIELLNDTPSKSENFKEFKEHRWDQSIFSILCKLNDVLVLSTSEIEGVPAILRNNPIIKLRDIAGRKMPYGSYKRFRIARIIKHPLLYIKLNIQHNLTLKHYFDH